MLPALRGAAAAWLAIQLLGLAAVLLLSRWLGPAEYGRLGLALVFGTYACYLSQWGIDPLLSRMLVRDQPEAARLHLAAFARQKQFSCVVLLLLGGVLALCWGEARALIFVGVLGGLILSFSVAPAFDARTRIGTYLFISALRQFSYLAAILALWFLAQGFFSALAVLIAIAASFALQVLLEWRWVRRQYGALQWRGASAAGWELLRQGTPMAVAFAAMQALTLCGPPLLETFSPGGTAELGLLVASNQLAMVAVSFLGLLSRLAHVRLAAIQDSGGAFFRRRAWLATLGFAVAGAGVALPAMLCSDWLVPLLFGRKFASAAPIFAVDVWRCVGALAGAILGSALICQHRVRAYAVCHLLALAAGLAVAWRFIPGHGAVAAAAAVAVGRAAFAIFAGVAFLTNRD